MARTSVYNIGEKKGIYCEGSNIAERIEWLSPSGEMVEGRSAKNTRVYVERRNAEPNLVALIIHSTKIEDSGNWTCQAGDISKFINIVVGEKVVLVPSVDEIRADEGKSVKLNCEAKGSPKPTVQWYKEDILIRKDNPRYIQNPKDDNYPLEMRKVTHKDAGNYTCKVTQESLSHYTHKSIYLRVHHKPILFNPKTNLTYTDYVTPGNKARQEEIFAVINETKNITCSALAEPSAKFEWYRRKNSYDSKLTDPSAIVQDNPHISTFMLNVRDEEDLGQYKCTAFNDRGSISIIYDVSQGEKPEPPENVTVHSANSTHITFNVTCGENCTFGDDKSEPLQPDNLPIIGYTFELVPVEEGFEPDWTNATSFNIDIEDPEDTLFEVGELPNKTSFHVRVRSQNMAGFSDWLVLAENPMTTDNAIRLAISLLLIVIALFITLCN